MNINVINLQVSVQETYYERLSRFLNQLQSEHLLYGGESPKEVYSGDEADEKVTSEIKKEFKSKGYKLIKCVERPRYITLFDARQYDYNYPSTIGRYTEAQINDTPDQIVRSYKREDSEGNIIDGFAFGIKNHNKRSSPKRVNKNKRK